MQGLDERLKSHCCEMMTEHVNHRCEDHSNSFDCPDNLILYSGRTKSYGIIVHDGGSSVIEIQFCPWCGIKLSNA